MKTAIITVFAAALIAAAPTVYARDASTKTPRVHHIVSKQRHAGFSSYAQWRVMHPNGVATGYPGAFGYAPREPHDYTLESSRQAGGGGGGGGGGM